MSSIMIVLAGANGTGKSTLYATRVAPNFRGPFINADIIQRDELGDASPDAAYEAARIAADRRQDFLNRREDFVTETVFSHPSKLDLVYQARARGFDIVLMHIGVDSPDISVARVAARVEEGGHPVPEDKIRARYARNGRFIRQAVLEADRGFVYDNSLLNAAPKRRLIFTNGRLTTAHRDLPSWILALYGDLLPQHSPKD